jgi:ribosomal protein S18 acetylase RimI-like enzyme
MNFENTFSVLKNETPENISRISFCRARLSDVTTIVELVNSAYRGESSRAGWTTEADILGGQRTDTDEISSLIKTKDSVILLCLCKDVVIGSVHLEKLDSGTAYLGMLVIKPTLQSQGLGKRFMGQAEEFTRAEWGIKRIQMQVITLRDELISYYQRRGYQLTGEVRPFPEFDPKFGLPKVKGLNLSVMEKILGAEWD